ncbi:MAG: immunoglobulin domain-containing protein [Saprospiraceae bacterium]
MLDGLTDQRLRQIPWLTLTCSGDPLIYKQSTVCIRFSFQWTADSIGHIIAGANSKNLSVDHAGTYTFVVTNIKWMFSSVGRMRG